MKRRINTVHVAVAGTLWMLAVTGMASASTVALTESTTSAGAVSTGVTTGLAPGSYTFANSFAGGSGSTPVLGSSSGFFDDYVFTVAGGTADAIASTIDLGQLLQIKDLQVALFSYTSGQTLPVFGTAAASSGTMIDGWSSPVTGNGINGTVAVIAPTLLGQGTYALEVRGLVTGTSGGSYAGVLNVSAAPVPLPAALPLLLSGLGGLGLWRRRRATIA